MANLTPSFGNGHIETLETEQINWQDFINQLLAKHKGIFQHLQLKEEGQPIIQAISSGHVVATSNGSFKDAQGMVAWMFYGSQDPLN